MRHVDFAPFYRSTVGFDRLLDLLGSGSGFDSEPGTYPPYNIERLGDAITALPWRSPASARTS